MVAGAGRPRFGVDTRQYRVLGSTYLGGRGDSLNADERRNFPRSVPTITPTGLVRHREASGWKPLHATVGASYGGHGGLCLRRVRNGMNTSLC